MPLRPLYAAPVMGCQAAVPPSSAIGYSECLRLGFRIVCAVDNGDQALDR